MRRGQVQQLRPTPPKSTRRRSSLTRGEPAPIVNPINTLPTGHLASMMASAPAAPMGQRASEAGIPEWKPSGALFRAPPRPAASVARSASTGGGTTSSLSLSVSLGPRPSSAESVATASEALPVNVESVRARQIELQGRKPSRKSPQKSPWRPPGLNDKVAPTRRIERAEWTPALQMNWRMSPSNSSNSDTVSCCDSDIRLPELTIGYAVKHLKRLNVTTTVCSF